MAKARTKKVGGDKRRVRDLGVKAATKVKGGASPQLLMRCTSGQHIK